MNNSPYPLIDSNDAWFDLPDDQIIRKTRIKELVDPITNEEEGQYVVIDSTYISEDNSYMWSAWLVRDGDPVPYTYTKNKDLLVALEILQDIVLNKSPVKRISKDNWISLNDRKPTVEKDTDAVLIWDSHYKTSKVVNTRYLLTWTPELAEAHPWERILVNPTHWMPEPEPPE